MDPLGIINSGAGYTSSAAATGARSTESGQSETAAGRSGTSVRAEDIRLPEDQVTLSGRSSETEASQPRATEQNGTKKQPKPGEKTTADGKSIDDPQVQQQISRLKQTEEKVKAHEAAHKAVGGNLASSASYSYTQGPDGRSYITGGEVQIDMSSGRTPEETISRMQQVIRAALAPADPSGQDRAVAAQASSQMAEAQQQKLQSESPTAKPDPTQPVEPAQEAAAEAADPTAAKDDKTAPNAPNGTDTRIQQAYGNPAVQGSDRTTDKNTNPTQPAATRSGSSSSQTRADLLISAFA